MLGQVDNQAQVLNSVLVNRPNRVVDETTRCQYGKCEYFCIVSRILVQSSNSLSIYHYDVDSFSICRIPFQGSPPTPQSLSAGIDSRADPESVAPVEEDSVEQVGLSSSIESSYTHNSNRPINSLHEVNSMLSELVFQIDRRVLPLYSTSTMGTALSTKPFSIFQI